eukprot:jgi/Orpsp1_1/1183857/evm.model.c7180000086948.1
MSLIYNPGSSLFEGILNNNEFYVDKTDLIIELNHCVRTNKKYVCVAIPKFFGKTVTASMIAAYYSYTEPEEKTNIFNNKKISTFENWDQYLGKFNVIQLDMDKIFYNCTYDEGINSIKENIILEVQQSLPNIEFSNKNNIVRILNEIKIKTGRQIVLIIDNWDVVLKNQNYEENSKMDYLNFLNYFIINKSYIALAFITGILPIRNSSFKSFTMISPLWMAKYIGYTENEVNELCQKLELNKIIYTPNKKQKLLEGVFNNIKEEIKEKEVSNEELFHKNRICFGNLKEMYSSYELTDTKNCRKYNIYCPYSVNNALNDKQIKNYWDEMEMDLLLSKYIENNIYRIKNDMYELIKSRKIKRNILNYYYDDDITKIESKKSILRMLVFLGYLCYDISNELLFIPNEEIHRKFELLKFKYNVSNESLFEYKYFNPGQEKFNINLKSNIYVDKTDLIIELNKIVNTNDRFVCVSSPRGFGKTVTADMIAAYYSYTEPDERTNIFNDKKISTSEDWDKYLGKFNVIQLDMSLLFNETDLETGIKKINKNNAALALVYMTGILPLKKFNSQSSLDCFDELTMTGPSWMEKYIGFTDDEIKELYNNNKEIKDFWNKTAEFNDIFSLISHDFDLLKVSIDTLMKLMKWKNVKINIDRYKNDIKSFDTKDDVLTMLIHLGYLGFNSETSEVYIPNKEVYKQFEYIIITNNKRW